MLSGSVIVENSTEADFMQKPLEFEYISEI